MFENKLIKNLQGIGPKKEKLFEKVGIKTYGDLLDYFPISYQDRTHPKAIEALKDGDMALIKARVVKIINTNFYRGKSKVFKFEVSDNTLLERLEIVFFNAFYMHKVIKLQEEYYFFGRVVQNGKKMQMSHPEIIKGYEFKKEIVPVYNLPAGISQKEMRKYVRYILENEFEHASENSDSTDGIREYLPKELLSKNNICPLNLKYKYIHFPQNKKEIQVARYRQIYEELFIMQLGINLMNGEAVQGYKMATDVADFIKSFEFELTQSQRKCVDDILENMASGTAMNRLLQGDVGSGKTAVAEIAMFEAVASGYQSAFMAPTEILAKQQFETISKHFAKFEKNVELLIGSMTTKQKRETIWRLKAGEIDVIIGTHALIQESVEFAKLGLVITDEQHRFGVNQRLKLSKKGMQPHVLVMTATPIPRTLTVALYGDLDVSIINTMPKGRKPIITRSVKKSERKMLYKMIAEHVKQGHQTYIVTPLIEPSEALENIKSTEEMYDELQEIYKGKNINIVVIHGLMKQAEKDDIMQRFKNGEIDVLIATVIIEVGIDVPNASMMVIENAERFGLAQLHQLRGRVGRGEEQSYCYLVNNAKSEIGKKRIDIICKTNDGFVIANEDINLRGPGEVFGTRQHGLADETITNAIKHMDILEKAQKDAQAYVKDVTLLLQDKVVQMFGDNLQFVL